MSLCGTVSGHGQLFYILIQESQIQLRMLRSGVDAQCPPPELVGEKILIPLVANGTRNLKFLKLSSSC